MKNVKLWLFMSSVLVEKYDFLYMGEKYDVLWMKNDLWLYIWLKKYDFFCGWNWVYVVEKYDVLWMKNNFLWLFVTIWLSEDNLLITFSDWKMTFCG